MLIVENLENKDDFLKNPHDLDKIVLIFVCF